MKPGVRLGLLLAGLLVVTWSIGLYAIATFTFVLGIPPGPILLGVSAFLFAILYHRLGGSRDPSHLRILVGLGLLLAIASVVLGNGMTDEWATTPRYARTLLAGHDFYTTPTKFTTCRSSRSSSTPPESPSPMTTISPCSPSFRSQAWTTGTSASDAGW